jgi:threonine/homoserine/homoserine lactone efflux protein
VDDGGFHGAIRPAGPPQVNFTNRPRISRSGPLLTALSTARLRSTPRATINGVVPTRHLAAFLLTVYALILVPGPSVLFVVGRGVALGRRAALATVFGNAAGLSLQLLAVAAGLGALITRSDTALTVLQVTAGIYLAILGARTVRDRRVLAQVADTEASPGSLRQMLREGLVVGATNPKGLIIFVAVLPRFVERSDGHETTQLLILGAVCVAIALLSDGAWALASGAARQMLTGSERRLERLTALGGLVLVALGLGLVVSETIL